MVMRYVMRYVDHRMVVPVVMPNMMVPYVDMAVMHFMMGHVADHNVDYRTVAPVGMPNMVVPHVDMTVRQFMVMRHGVDHNVVPVMRFMVMRYVDHHMVVPVVMPNMMVPYVDMAVMHFMMGHVADHSVDYRTVVP